MDRILLKLRRFSKFERNPCTSSRNSTIIMYNNGYWRILTLSSLIDHMIADDYNNEVYSVVFTNNIIILRVNFFVFLFRCGSKFFRFQTDSFACDWKVSEKERLSIIRIRRRTATKQNGYALVTTIANNSAQTLKTTMQRLTQSTTESVPIVWAKRSRFSRGGNRDGASLENEGNYACNTFMKHLYS